MSDTALNVLSEDTLAAIQQAVIAREGDSNDDEIESLWAALEGVLTDIGHRLPTYEQIDQSSSASRQHYIDTGRYLLDGEAESSLEQRISQSWPTADGAEVDDATPPEDADTSTG